MNKEAWRAKVHGGCKKLDTTEQLTSSLSFHDSFDWTMLE